MKQVWYMNKMQDIGVYMSGWKVTNNFPKTLCIQYAMVAVWSLEAIE